MNEREILILPDIEELSRKAAGKFIEIGQKFIKEKGVFTVALSGGSTPKSLFKWLTNNEFRNQIEWQNVRFFWGDERHVPPNNDESNFKMANENLLAPLNIEPEKVFRWITELKVEIAAEEYETSLRDFFKLEKDDLPRFDLILLGMGDDGHTASLFPYTKAIHETEKLAVANFVEKFDKFRLTLTPKVFNNAANVMFLIAGKDKAAALPEVLEGKREVEKYPSQLINPTDGKLTFLIDTQAGQNLSSQ